MKNAGYEPIIRALAALPGTAEQVHQRMGGDVALVTVADWLRSAVRTGLAYIERVDHVGPRLFVRHFALGSGPSAHWPHAGKDGGRSLVTIIALAALVEALEQGPTLVADLSDEVGMDRRAVHIALNLLRKYRLARVGGWLPDRYGRPVPAWRMGAGRDARKPPPTPRKVTNAKAWARRRERLAHRALLEATAGSTLRRAA